MAASTQLISSAPTASRSAPATTSSADARHGRVGFRRAGTRKLTLRLTAEARRRLEGSASTRAQLSVRVARRGASTLVYTRPVIIRR